MPALPDVVKNFIASHKPKSKITIKLSIPTFDNGEHELELVPDSATRMLAGEESDDLDLERHVGLGVIAGSPVVIDVSQKALPVTILLDGVLESIGPFSKLEKSVRVEKPVVPIPAGKLIDPKTVVGPEDPAWPTGRWLLATYAHAGDDFFWIEEQVKPKDMREVYYKQARCGQPAAAQWPAATTKMDRGTSKFLDVGRFGMLLAVTPRVRAILERYPMKGVEFLPIRVSIKAAKADYFVVNPTLRVECLDRAKCEFPTAERVAMGWKSDPKKLVMREAEGPKDTWLFRPEGIDWPPVIASGELVKALRAERLSGLGFRTLSEWK